jgi:HD-GYP domain-containing protein (c-di-GMP phosphodiesterase class II)
LGERRSELVRVAALLQDIGTLGIPAHVLSKPDILTLDEMMLMQKHPTLARNIVGEIPGMGAVAWWVGCHHERVDGKGYPGMLEGEAVPVEAQIIGICEAYEALTSNRPYRRAMGRDDASEVLRGLADSRFDATVIRRLEEVLMA